MEACSSSAGKLKGLHFLLGSSTVTLAPLSALLASSALGIPA
jgi:hypothetical protein